MQQGMLFHALSEPGAGLYVPQVLIHLRRPVQDAGPRPTGVITLIAVHLGIDREHGSLPSRILEREPSTHPRK